MNNQLSFQDKYQAVQNRDTSFEGIFITTVKTTGIFCRPGCTARTPNAENPKEPAKNLGLKFFDRKAIKLPLPVERPAKIVSPNAKIKFSEFIS